MTKAKKKKAPAKKIPPEKVVKLNKDELFAFSYIKHMGNGVKAAMEALDVSSEHSANTQACSFLRKPAVQKIVSDFLDSRREQFKKFADSHAFYLTRIAEEFLNISTDKEVPVSERMAALRQLARLAGVELGESVAVAKATAKGVAMRQAVLPGNHAPTTPSVDSRQTIFMLSPPPIPPGGQVPPALAEQWAQFGWKPGMEIPSKVEDTGGHGAPPPTVRPAS